MLDLSVEVELSDSWHPCRNLVDAVAPEAGRSWVALVYLQLPGSWKSLKDCTGCPLGNPSATEVRLNEELTHLH